MFIFNDISSKDFGITIISDNHLDKPKRNIELVQVHGRTGYVVVDNGSYENLSLEIQIAIDATERIDLVTTIEHIYKWLSTNDYKKITFADGVSFSAILTSDIKIDKFNDNVATAKLTFSCF